MRFGTVDAPCRWTLPYDPRTGPAPTRRNDILGRILPRLTYANVVATLALFIALGGTTYAAVTITGANVRNNSLTGADIRNGSLRAVDFRPSDVPQGPRGPRGPEGDRGADGAPGAPGAPGARGEIGCSAVGSPIPDTRQYCQGD